APNVMIEPARADVKLPRRFARQLESQKLEARLDLENLSDSEDNIPRTLQVPVSVPASIPAMRATIVPATVNVTFTVRKQTDSHVLRSVPVMLVISPKLLETYDVKIAEDQLFVNDIKVTGPSDAIR